MEPAGQAMGRTVCPKMHLEALDNIQCLRNGIGLGVSCRKQRWAPMSAVVYYSHLPILRKIPAFLAKLIRSGCHSLTLA
jgi:hypothetical protein